MKDSFREMAIKLSSDKMKKLRDILSDDIRTSEELLEDDKENLKWLNNQIKKNS